jgi:hypothetical protein
MKKLLIVEDLRRNKEETVSRKTENGEIETNVMKEPSRLLSICA